MAPLALEGPTIERRMRLLQPVDRDVAAIDPMGARRGQKDDDVGHLLGLLPWLASNVINV